MCNVLMVDGKSISAGSGEEKNNNVTLMCHLIFKKQYYMKTKNNTSRIEVINSELLQ